MTLYYISLQLDYDKFRSEKELRSGFEFNTRFISNYLSKQARKLKFKTADFNMISISLTESELMPSKIVPIDVLEVQLPFDRTLYSKIKGTSDCNYYLDLFEKGFKKASEFKQIPYAELLQLIETFKKENCKNEWIELKKKFKDDDLEITFKSEFTTNYYQVMAIINQISTKKELVSGIIIRTQPDEIFFGHLTKSIEIGRQIIVKDKFNNPVIEINKENVFKGKLNFKILHKSEYYSLSYMT